jgi:LDH2 family malate/lactate/ureidoglycolate dehydrogenase
MKDFGKEPLLTSAFYMSNNPAAFMPLDQFRARADRLARHIKASETAAGAAEVYVAGEIEFRHRVERLRDGIPVSELVWRELETLAAEHHLPFELV